MGNVFDPRETRLEDLIDGKYKIPVYQRPYSWEKMEIEEFLNDIYNNYKKKVNKELLEDYTMFIGTLYLRQTNKISNKVTEYDVIDGQQRLATISLILLTALDYASFHKFTDENILLEKLRNALWKRIEREQKKEQRLIELGNIDKSVWLKLMDHVYNKEGDLFHYVRTLDLKNSVEKRVISNYKIIHGFFADKFSFDNNEFFNFIDYLLYDVKCIVIYVQTSLKKLFEVFESINSKGKELQEIDLIKSYIFQKIDEKNYDQYLKLWGELISETDDNLEDYLYIFVKAKIKYYKTKIKIRNFKTLAENYINENYNSRHDIGKALMLFIDDMIANVKYYRMLNDVGFAKDFIKSSEFNFYLNVLLYFGYEHPKPLIFKFLSEYENNCNTEEIIKVLKNSINFMIVFQTLVNRESKSALIPFENIMKYSYENKLSNEYVYNTFNSSFLSNNITQETIKSSLLNHRGYKKGADARYLLALSLFTDDKGQVDYERVKYILNNKKDIQLDHIMPLNPVPGNFSYYVKGESLIIKEDHDFGEGIYSGMSYKDFKDNKIHRLGNIKLAWKKDNLSKSNNFINLPEYGIFTQYSQITSRVRNITEKVISSNIISLTI